MGEDVAMKEEQKRMALKILESRLYKTYYPIKTVAEKDIFLSENRTKILRAVDVFIREMQYDSMRIVDDCANQLKRPLSVFGNVKCNNVKHNIYVLERRNRLLQKAEDRIDDFTKLKERIQSGSTTIEDANTILRTIEKRHQRDILTLTAIMLLLCFGILVYAFLIH